MMLRHLLLLFAIIVASNSSAQTFSGKVIDESGVGLPGAFITAQKASGDVLGEVSLPDGTYTLDLRAWAGENVTLSCSYIGMETLEREFANLQAGYSYTLDWSLASTAEALDLVVVSAGRFEQSAAEVTVSVDVLPPRIVESRGTTTLETALEMNPGVTFVNGEPQIRSGSGFSYGAGSRVMIMVDDLPVLSGDAGRPTWGFLPLENLEQIEIIKGASSVLYGSAALSGVINVRTRFPDARPLTRITRQVGVYADPRTTQAKTWNVRPQQSNLRFLHSQQLGTWDIVIGGNILRDDGFLAPEETAQFNARDYHFSPSLLGLDLLDRTVDRYGAEYRTRVNANLRKRETKVNGLVYGLNTNWQLGESLNTLIWQVAPDSIYGAFGGAATRTNQLIGTFDPYVQYLTPGGTRHSFRNRWQYLNNDNDNEQSNGSHVIYSEYQIHTAGERWGIEGLNLTTGVVNMTALSRAELYSGGSSDGNNAAANRAAYIQVDQAVGERVKLAGGARYEYFTVNGIGAGKPVFRLGGNFQVAEATFIRSSFGQGFRFPTIAERYIRTGLGALQIYPNEDLRPEFSWSTEVAIKQGFAFKNTRAGDIVGFLDVALFRQDYEDFIEFTFGQWGPDEGQVPNIDNAYGLGFMSANTGGSRVSGIETSITGRWTTRSFQADFITGYTYTNPISTTPDYNYNPDPEGATTTYMSTSYNTEGMLLKYRSPHVVRFDVQVSGQKFFGGMSMRYQTALKNFDAAFIEFEESSNLSGINWGVRGWLEEHPELPWIFDARFGREWPNGHKLSLVISNLTNAEYTIRPLAMEAPRLTSLMYTYQID
ncbi:MAG: TonB-dependent receptor [Flavobacteriales bacterium]